MADNRRKGVSATDAVTIHATPEFSREHWAAPDRDVIASLLAAADLASPPLPDRTGLQRWRYATPVVQHPAHCLVASGVPPLVFGGDAFGDAKVEGAALSGAAAATALAPLLV